MAKALTVSTRVISLFGRIDITDEQGQLCYYGKGEFSLLRRRWRIFDNNDNELAQIIHKRFAIRPTFLVSGQLGDMMLQRKFFSLKREYWVTGGPYDGATFKGNLLDLAFTIMHNGKLIAKAAEKLISIRDTHRVELTSSDANDELFTVIAMIAMQLEKKASD
ncbi:MULTISPECIES: LURP-one-related/scramblase family protein [Pseudidiomarina]|uniref:LURP-one-related family protein n=2 Tax=Pseudidiomarina TaxID=2800384 RepID=A0A432YJ47_9GAMM|nr:MULTISPECIES: hypothetical protein [Pseudidiomarina]MDS0218605.1 hypothetical protein [Pseudidiomarina andamanensis]QGT95471.1 hypothetical protein D3795_04440 [Pseudidiomarina andamanensis]RUO60895.1 hypothetical protein CWI76_01040 [Pseudidiomarina marina]